MTRKSQLSTAYVNLRWFLSIGKSFDRQLRTYLSPSGYEKLKPKLIKIAQENNCPLRLIVRIYAMFLYPIKSEANTLTITTVLTYAANVSCSDENALLQGAQVLAQVFMRGKFEHQDYWSVAENIPYICNIIGESADVVKILNEKGHIDPNALLRAITSYHVKMVSVNVPPLIKDLVT